MIEKTGPHFEQFFDTLLARGEVEEACRLAMNNAEIMLSTDASSNRKYVFDRYFRRLDENYSAQYQSYDFEICDYNMFSYSPDCALFRGPRPLLPDLINGRFITIFGAAQLFGRFHRNPFFHELGSRLNFPFLNLSLGGAGPAFFLREPFISTANRGVAVILQVLSARSVGCDEYPGMRMTSRVGSRSPLRDRIEVLTSIWNASPLEAARLVAKWQAIYLRQMNDLINALRVPVFLVWISNRLPADWSAEKVWDTPDFGSFPQLVDAPTMAALESKVQRSIRLSPDIQTFYPLASRLTGASCPFFFPTGEEGWVASYYPSEDPHRELANALESDLQSVIRSSSP